MINAELTSANNQGGRQFGRYHLTKRLAFGGMAEVYLAQLTGAANFNKWVVVKLVLPQFAENPEFLELFLDEGRLAARLSHPNIAQTFEMGEADGRLFMAMEYVPGESVHSILRQAAALNKPIPLQFSLHVTLQLLSALDYAHSQKDDHGWPLYIVHRDVSPSNVMVTYDGTAKLLDFGVARAVCQSHKSEVGLLKGKPAYMAPEQQLPGPVDCRADIFAAGTILYELTTGRRAFYQDTPLELLTSVKLARFDPPKSINPDFPANLERIILKAMARVPDQRYQTAASFRSELGIFASSIGMFPGQGEFGNYIRELFKDHVSATRGAKPKDGPVDRGVEQITPDDILTPFQPPPPELLQAISSGRKLEAKAEPKPWQSSKWSHVGAWAVVVAIWTTLVALGMGGGSFETPAARDYRREPKVAPTATTVATREILKPAPRQEETKKEPEPPPSLPKRRRPAQPTASAALPFTGSLKLESDSPARVSEQGRLLGVTPLHLNLPAGEHQLQLEDQSRGIKRTVNLTIVGGETTRHFEKL